MDGAVSFAGWWGEALWRLSVQAALLIGLAWLAEAVLRRASPTLRYGLWCLVLARLCVPLPLSLPVGVEPQVRGRVEAALVRVAEPAFASTAAPSGGAAAYAEAGPGTWGWAAAGWAWFAAAGALGVATAWRTYRSCRRAASAPLVLRESAVALVDDLRAQLGLACPVGLHYEEDARISGPAATGLWQPRVVLPRRMAEQWPLEALRPILAHELTHVRRFDLAVNAVQVVVAVFYFFHPLVWLANARLRQLREEACDDAAIEALRRDRKGYGQSLLRAVEEAGSAGSLACAAAGFLERKSSLARRVVRITQPGYAFYRKVTPLAAVGMAVVAMACVAVSSGTAVKATLSPAPAALEAATPAPVPGTADTAPVPGTAEAEADQVVQGQRWRYARAEVERMSVDDLFVRVAQPDPAYHNFAAPYALGAKARIAGGATRDEIVRRTSTLLRDEASQDYSRFLYCYLLSATGDPRAIPELERALVSDPRSDVRGAAACALGALPAEQVDGVLRRARDKVDTETQFWVDRAIAGAFRRP